MQKPKVLILCTGNSCRSHMAEGILSREAGDLFDVYSAGSEPAGFVHPVAIEVMAEIGIDLSAHRSKSLCEYTSQRIDTVITVCDQAAEVCPIFPGQARRYHWSFPDPAKAAGDESAVKEAFRLTRDGIRGVFVAYVAGYREAAAGVAAIAERVGL